jgi:hypothetical protein
MRRATNDNGIPMLYLVYRYDQKWARCGRISAAISADAGHLNLKERLRTLQYDGRCEAMSKEGI